MFKDKDKDQDELRRTVDGQDQPGKVWQESDQSQYTGHGDTFVGGSDPDVRKDTKDEQPENEQIDESQWQGNRFAQGGFGNQGRTG